MIPSSILSDERIANATAEELRASANYAETTAKHRREEGNHVEGAELEAHARRLRAVADEMEGGQ